MTSAVHSQSAQRERVFMDSTPGKNHQATIVMTASYRRSWTSATPAGAPPTALRVSSTAKEEKGEEDREGEHGEEGRAPLGLGDDGGDERACRRRGRSRRRPG